MADLDGQKLSCEFFDSNRTPFDLQITLIFLEEEKEERKGWLDFEENKGIDRRIGMNPAGLDKLSFFLSFPALFRDIACESKSKEGNARCVIEGTGFVEQ